MRRRSCPAAKVFAFTANTSWSGRLNGTTCSSCGSTCRPSWSPLNLTMMPVSGAVTDCSHAGSASSCRQLVDGPGTPPGTVPVPVGHWAGAGRRPRREAVRDARLEDRRGLIARVERRDVDVRAVGRERARRVGEEGEDPQRRAAERCAQVGGVEHPDVGAADALRGELRVAGTGHAGDRCVGAMLAAVRRADERAVAARAREHDVARLVADEQRAHDPGGAAARSTTLTLSERWLTTQTSVSVRAATATGSMPTGIERAWVSVPPGFTTNTSRRLSGMFVTNKREPLGESATGRTGPLSNSMNVGTGGTDDAGRAASDNRPAIRAARFMMDSRREAK